jgi:hypothetical protein
MPKGPKGEKRPPMLSATPSCHAQATGEIEQTIPDDGKDPAAKALGKKAALLPLTCVAVAPFSAINSLPPATATKTNDRPRSHGVTYTPLKRIARHFLLSMRACPA